MNESLLEDYEKRAQKYTRKSLALGNQQSTMQLLLLAGAALLDFQFFPSTRASFSWWPTPIALALGGYAAWNVRNNSIRKREAMHLRDYFRTGRRRLRSEWREFEQTGEAYLRDDHFYQRDLDILGEGSLFQAICTARTELGRQRLADFLLELPPPGQTRSRQEAVKELKQELENDTGLRERLALVGRSNFSDCDPDSFTEWLAAPPKRIPAFLPPIMLLSAVSAVLLFFAGISTLLPWPRILPYLGSLLAAQGAIGLWLQDWTKQTLKWATAFAKEVPIMREGAGLFTARQQGENQFRAPLLQQIAGQLGPAEPSLRTLERITGWIIERNKDHMFWVAFYTMGGTQLAMALERWRARHGRDLPQWLDAWAEFEALNALACYAYEHPTDAFPEVIEDSNTEDANTPTDAGPNAAEPNEMGSDATGLDATGLGHPLIQEEDVVRNDVAFDSERRFLVISGSNMSGKSTLLRAIGVNVVLARAGAPVRASSMRLGPLDVCPSIATQDSLLGGTSRFMAEVERIRDTLERANAGEPVLFLFDEIFSGTNSTDRRTAAEAVIRALIKQGAIGAITTHDLALAEIADMDGLGGENVHMAARSDDAPLDFDYRLQPGVNRQSNALAIARMAGVPV